MFEFEKKERIPIVASEGHILTNGEIYGKQIFLAEGMSEADFYEIDEEEYTALRAAEEVVTDEA